MYVQFTSCVYGDREILKYTLVYLQGIQQEKNNSIIAPFYYILLFNGRHIELKNEYAMKIYIILTFNIERITFLSMLTGKKHHHIKLTKSTNMGTWVVGTTNQLLKRVS